MYQIISKYLNTVKKILLDDEIPPTFENLKYYFNEDDVLIEIKNNIGIPNTIRLIYLLVLLDRGISGEKIKDVVDKLKVYNIKKYIDEETRTVSCDECNGYGNEDCMACDGGGDVECSNCSGNGTTACDDCDGSGRETCGNCGGDGQFDCDYCGGSGDVESDDTYFQPDDHYFIKPFSSKDEDYLGKPYEIDKLTDFFENDNLSMYMGKNYEGFSDYDTDQERREYRTDLREFETLFEMYNLDYVTARLFQKS